MLSIHDRPFPPEDRTQPGHWEGDLIVGPGHQSAIGTLVERQTRTIRLLHLPARDADALRAAIGARMADLPAWMLRSITWDQGTEMAAHATVAAVLDQGVFFAHPGSPWQRPSNENTVSV
jgi:IS30 family transposase